MRTILVTLLLIVISVAGCSNRGIYEDLQNNRRNECLKLLPAERDECLEHVGKPYDEYERERQEVLNE